MLFLVPLTQTYLSVLCGLNVEYLEVDNKTEHTWVVGFSAGVYLLCFFAAAGYIYLTNRRQRRQLERRPTQSYEMLPLESVDEEI